MYACICRGVSEADVRRAGRAGITAPDDLIRALGLDDDRCCGQCVARIGEFVELAWEGFAQAGLQSADGARVHVLPVVS